MQLPCPAGRYGARAGLLTSNCSGACPGGAHCGAGTVAPVPCPAGAACAPGALIGISVIGTQRWSDLVREATEGSAQVAQAIHNEFALPIMDAVFENQLHKTFTSYFAATKEALHQMGQLKSARVRAPLVAE